MLASENALGRNKSSSTGIILIEKLTVVCMFLELFSPGSPKQVSGSKNMGKIHIEIIPNRHTHLLY
jgi:hypothetical protein